MKLFILVLSLAVSLQTQAAENLTYQDHVRRLSTDAVDTTGLWILGGGALAGVLAFQMDTQVKEQWGHHQIMDDKVSKFGEFWGEGIPEIVILGGQLYWDKEKAIPSIEGMLMGQLIVHTSKRIIGRERPDHSEKVSMPSGHSQASFSLATSITSSYGFKKTWPLWGLAVFTAASRIADDRHWLSDTVIGATLGIFWGRAGFQHHGFEPLVSTEAGRFQSAGLIWKKAF